MSESLVQAEVAKPSFKSYIKVILNELHPLTGEAKDNEHIETASNLLGLLNHMLLKLGPNDPVPSAYAELKIKVEVPDLAHPEEPSVTSIPLPHSCGDVVALLHKIVTGGAVDGTIPKVEYQEQRTPFTPPPPPVTIDSPYQFSGTPTAVANEFLMELRYTTTIDELAELLTAAAKHVAVGRLSRADAQHVTGIIMDRLSPRMEEALLRNRTPEETRKLADIINNLRTEHSKAIDVHKQRQWLEKLTR